LCRPYGTLSNFSLTRHSRAGLPYAAPSGLGLGADQIVSTTTVGLVIHSNQFLLLDQTFIHDQQGEPVTIAREALAK